MDKKLPETSLASRQKFCLNMLRHSPLHDDRMMTELAATDEPGSDEVRAAFLAAQEGDIHKFNACARAAVQEYAEHHGFDVRAAFTHMILAQLDANWADLEKIMAFPKTQQ